MISKADFPMFISYTVSAANGFKKWSASQSKGSNDNDQPGGITPIALADPLILDPNPPLLVVGIRTA
jgi:hypothetical protein